jgi:Phage protein (N4 Gp49/phage Sf6 gene 66) family
MSMQDSDREAAAVAVAPRVALADLEAAVACRYDFTADKAIGALNMPGHQALEILSICILVMANGFTVIGKSAPASPANFNAELGRKFAYEDCIRQLWPLAGYALRQRLAEEKSAP